MPDRDGMVRGAERKAWGILGKPPDNLAMAHPLLIQQWKKLALDAKTVMNSWGPGKTERAKEIERRRAQLVRDIELNTRLLRGQS